PVASAVHVPTIIAKTCHAGVQNPVPPEGGVGNPENPRKFARSAHTPLPPVRKGAKSEKTGPGGGACRPSSFDGGASPALSSILPALTPGRLPAPSTDVPDPRREMRRFRPVVSSDAAGAGLSRVPPIPCPPPRSRYSRLRSGP